MLSMICGGDHASDIQAIYQRNGLTSLSIYDDATNPPPKSLNSRIVIGINSPTERKQIAYRFRHLVGCEPLVDPSVILGLDVRMGKGVVIGPSSVLLHAVVIGQHVHINYSVSMTRCTIGDYTTVSPGVTICGGVSIGDTCWVGASSTICDRVTIGNDCVIGAGAIVLPEANVPDGTTVVGIYK